MLTGELRGKVDRVWDAFWSGGIANPLKMMEQITTLLFIRGLDDVHTCEENRANTLRKPMRAADLPPRARTRRADPTRTCAGPTSRDGRRPRRSRSWPSASSLSSAR